MATIPPHISDEKMNYWREMRQLIMHEDNLVNHRFSWLLTYEGFLMGGFFLLQSNLLSNKTSCHVIIVAEIFLLPISLASMLICFISGQTISAAHGQTATVRRAWERRYPEEGWNAAPVSRWFLPLTPDLQSESADQFDPPQGSGFPPILGRTKCETRLDKLGLTLRIPFILCTINLLAALSCVAIAAYAYARPASLCATPPVVQDVQSAAPKGTKP